MTASTPARRGIVCGRLAASRSFIKGIHLYAYPAGAYFCMCASSRALLHVGSLSLWDRQPSNAPPLLLSPAGLASRRGPHTKTRLGAVPQDPLTLKLRLDTNDALASSVRRRRYALKVPAAHFYVEIVDRVPLPRCGGGGRGRGQMRLRLPLERICAQYGFGFFG